MARQTVFVVLAVALLAGETASAEGCDCRKLSLAPSPVCGVDSITYINHCVAECQGVELQHESECTAAAADGQTLHLKASSTADTQGEQQRAGEGASITSAATVDLSTADSEASVDLEVLTRYASTGFKFAAKMLLKSSLGNTDPMAVKATTEGQSALAGNRTLLAARLDANGHLYLKSSPASELAAAFMESDSQVVLPPGLPKGVPSLASQQAQQGLQQQKQQRINRRLLLADQPQQQQQGSGRGLLVTSPDGRVEISTAAYPYSAVGLLTFENADGEGGICSGALVGPRSVLTAGHCVYDTMARQFYDVKKMAFIPNQHGGRRPSPDQKMTIQSVLTYFNNAAKPLKCDDGTYRCQENSDWEVDFSVITLEEPADEKYGFLGVGYECGTQRYAAVDTAGYPGDLPGCPWRMYGDSGALDAFDACEEDLGDSVVTSTLDIYPGQSGSAVWDSGNMIRALVNAMGSEGEAYHRTIGKWVAQAIKDEVAAASS